MQFVVNGMRDIFADIDADCVFDILNIPVFLDAIPPVDVVGFGREDGAGLHFGEYARCFTGLYVDQIAVVISRRIPRDELSIGENRSAYCDIGIALASQANNGDGFCGELNDFAIFEVKDGAIGAFAFLFGIF